MRRPFRPVLSRLALALLGGLAACGGNIEGGGGKAGTGLATKLAAPDSVVINWVKCADEYQICTVPGTTKVRYGLNGTYAIQTVSGSIECSNEVFGDPLPGADKICEYATPAPTPTPTPAPNCEGVIDRCFDLTASQVAKYKDNKTSAASYTFDDGYASSDKIATIFENAGARATFYIVPDTVDDITGWPFWKAMAEKGHEVGNHSMTHTVDMSNPNLSDAELHQEINVSQTTIEQQIGFRPLTFAFPWHAYTQRAFEMALQKHFAVREVAPNDPTYRWVFFDQDHASSLDEALQQANATLTEVVNIGGWMVAGGHGVNGDGWSPVTSQFLQTHLAHASQYGGQLWIDTYANVVRYRRCRDQVSPEIVSSSTSQALIRLQGSFNAGLCTAPLTVSIPTKEPLSGEVSAHTQAGIDVPVSIVNGRLLFEMRPGQELILKVTQ